MSLKRELALKPITELLTIAFGKGADGTNAVEAYLNEIPEGETSPRRLAVFGISSTVEQAIAARSDLIQRIVDKNAPAPTA